MRAKIALLLSASLLSGTIAAQPLPCTSVAPEVRDRVREAGACRDATPEDIALKGNLAPSSAVTMKLSDGTVVRIPREISSNINDGRKRALTNEPALPKSAQRARKSAQSAPAASPAPALQTLEVPDVIGRNFADAGSVLADFKVDRIETASAAPSGEVLAQEPAPATAVPPGSTVSLQISDGSLASAADTAFATAPAIEAKTPSSPESTADPVPVSATAPAAAPATGPAAAATAPVTASDSIVPAGPRAPFPIAFSTNAALILGTGVFFGLLLGALFMRQWLLRRKLEVHEDAALPPRLHQHEQPVEPRTSEVETAPEITFAARLEPGETTINLVLPPGGEEVEMEQSSDQHAY